ncbi:MAG: leucine-rich repeat protein, partial [Verrucomicrobia bacterium]|nr:leucine-rich repeat protein [Verrucomicrobiota bacterium]
ITIPDSVTNIANHAFSECTSLTNITIGNMVTIIGDYAFSHCTSLTSIIIPNKVTIIGDYAFSNCLNVTSITIGNMVTIIGDYAFSHCTSLTSITIPDSVTNIANYAFSECTSLTSITIGNNVTIIGDYAFSQCTSLTSIIIPNKVTIIGDYAFSGCLNVTNITIGNNVTIIGDYAFSHCTSLTSIIIPNSVTIIGDYAFSNCLNVTSITIGNNVTIIGDYAFSQCTSLTSITIPDSVTSIGHYAFSGCLSLTLITIGNNVTLIGDAAFYGCIGLTRVTIGNRVTSIGNQAFYNCASLTGVYFLGNAPSLGLDVFFNDSLATVYYLAWTTGWGSTFGGRPTALWNLEVAMSGFSLIASWTGGVNVNAFSAVRGSEFVVRSNDLVVTHLGYYDAAADGLLEAHDIGVFGMDGALLVSAAVSAGTGAFLTNGFRYVGLVSPLLLRKNTSYVLAATLGSSNNDNTVEGVTGIATGDGALQFVGSRYAPTNGLAYPSATSSSNWIAANFIAGVPPSIVQPPQDWTSIAGENVAFTVIAGGTAPLFYQWRKQATNLTDSGHVSGATSPNLTLADVQTDDAGNYSVVVTSPYGSVTSSVARLVVNPVPNCVLIDVTPGGGIVMPDPFQSSFPPNSSVKLTALPENGWTFLDWKGNAQGTNPEVTLQVTWGTTFRARFGTEISVTPSGNGTVRVIPQSLLYPYGAAVRIVAEPEPGNCFTGWSGSANGDVNPLTMIVQDGHPAILASFDTLPAGRVALTAIPDGYGVVSVEPQGNTFSIGQAVTNNAIADNGQEFLGWSGDATGTNNPLVVTMNQSKIITARFTKRPRLHIQPLVLEGLLLTLTGEFSASYCILRSTDIVNWEPYLMLTNAYGEAQMIDPPAANQCLYYQAVGENTGATP